MKVVQLCPALRPHGLYSPWNSPGQSTEVGSLSLLQGIFPTQGSNTGIKSRSPALEADSLPAEPQGKPGDCQGLEKWAITIQWISSVSWKMFWRW